MGCAFVMAIPDFYSSDNSFTECDGDVAAPPGLYPQADGSTSTFRQRYTGTYTAPGGATELWTVGQTITPSAPAWYPATSNCVTYSTISNGVDPANLMVTAAPVVLRSGTSSTVSVSSTSGATTPVSGSVRPTSAASGSASGSAGASSASASAASGSSRSGSGASSAASGGASNSAGAAATPSGAAGRAADLSSTPVILAAAFGGIGAIVGAIVAL